MANTLTVKTGYTEGVTTRSDGFTPVVCKRFDAASLGIAANAQVVALKVPEGCILRYVIIDVKTVGTGTLAVGSHVGGLADTGITTATTTYSSSSPADLTALGKTLYTPSAAIVAASHYIVITPSAAQAAAVFEVTAIVDVFDVEAYAG